MSITVILIGMGDQRAPGGLPSFWRGYPPDERKEGLPMVTYSDLFLFCTLMVSLVGLCYTIFTGKK